MKIIYLLLAFTFFIGCQPTKQQLDFVGKWEITSRKVNGKDRKFDEGTLEVLDNDEYTYKFGNLEVENVIYNEELNVSSDTVTTEESDVSGDTVDAEESDVSDDTVDTEEPDVSDDTIATEEYSIEIINYEVSGFVKEHDSENSKIVMTPDVDESTDVYDIEYDYTYINNVLTLSTDFLEMELKKQ